MVIKTEPPSENNLDPSNKDDPISLMSSTASNGLVRKALKRLHEESLSAEHLEKMTNTSKNAVRSCRRKKENGATSCVKQELCDSLPLKVKLPVKKRKASQKRSKGVTELVKNELKTPKVQSHVCVICNRSYLHHSTLKRHAQSHTNEPYKCDVCGKIFKHHSGLFKHRSVHTGERPFSCEVCGKTFRTKEVFKVHGRIHQGEKPYACKFCGRPFTQKTHLDTHERTHTGERPFQCEVCGLRFKRRDTAKSHRENVHGDIEKLQSGDTSIKIFKCRSCELSFDNKSELLAHRLEHWGPKDFKCDECEREFYSEYSLKKHIAKGHDLAQFICEMCGKSYATKQGLWKHKEIHSEDQGKKFKCPICPKTFRVKTSMQKHQVTHTGERPFKCKLCDTRLTCHGNLQRHYQQVHKQNRTKDWVCKTCGERFLTQWLMKMHNKTHTIGDSLEVAPPIEDSTAVPPDGGDEHYADKDFALHSGACGPAMTS